MGGEVDERKEEGRMMVVDGLRTTIEDVGVEERYKEEETVRRVDDDDWGVGCSYTTAVEMSQPRSFAVPNRCMYMFKSRAKEAPP